jgi:hypothetical protein
MCIEPAALSILSTVFLHVIQHFSDLQTFMPYF